MRQEWVFFALAVVTAACTGVHTVIPRREPEGYAFHRVEEDNLAIHWNLTRTQGQAVAEGYIQHVGGVYTLRYITMILQGLDGDGKVVNEAKTIPSPDWLLGRGEQGLFRLVMPLKGPEREFTIRADFRVHIQRDDGDGDKRSRFRHLAPLSSKP